MFLTLIATSYCRVVLVRRCVATISGMPYGRYVKHVIRITKCVIRIPKSVDSESKDKIFDEYICDYTNKLKMDVQTLAHAAASRRHKRG